MFAHISPTYIKQELPPVHVTVVDYTDTCGFTPSKIKCLTGSLDKPQTIIPKQGGG